MSHSSLTLTPTHDTQLATLAGIGTVTLSTILAWGAVMPFLVVIAGGIVTLAVNLFMDWWRSRPGRTNKDLENQFAEIRRDIEMIHHRLDEEET